jgi:hypothetical protein
MTRAHKQRVDVRIADVIDTREKMILEISQCFLCLPTACSLPARPEEFGTSPFLAATVDYIIFACNGISTR